MLVLFFYQNETTVVLFESFTDQETWAKSLLCQVRQTNNGELPTFTPRTLVVLSWRLSLDDYLCHWGSRCIVVDVCMSGCKYACISCMYMLVCTKSIKEGMCKCLTIVFVYLYRCIHFTLMTNADNNKQWNFYIHWPVSCLRYSLVNHFFLWSCLQMFTCLNIDYTPQYKKVITLS